MIRRQSNELTPSSLIDRLGGNKVVADLCGVGASAVSNYRRDGFPERVQLKIFKACQDAEIKLPPDFFERNAATTDHRNASNGSAA